MEGKVYEVCDMAALFNPKSVAIVGASSRLDSISGRPLKLLKRYGYKGNIYPVNPKYEELAGYKCYPSISSLPETPDVVMVGVRANLVEGVLKECAQRDVPFVIIFSSGFAESEEGLSQDRLLEIVKGKKTRIIGPNCQGLVNLGDGIPLSFSASLDTDRRPVGSVAYVSQSGAFGYASFAMAADEGVGFKYVITTGNQADLDVVDFALYLVNDPDVDIVILYLEGVSDGRKFLHLCEVARKKDKPLAVLKVGKSPTAQKAAQSHTAALTGEEALWDAVFERYGVIPLYDSLDITNVARAFCVKNKALKQSGKNIAVLTTSGGAGIIMTDRCYDEGLDVPELSLETQNKIKDYIPHFGSTKNPIDMTAQVINDPAGFKGCLRATNEDDSIDAIACIISMITGESGKQMARDLVEFYNNEAKKPTLCCWIMDQEHGHQGLWEIVEEGKVPLFHSIQRTAKSLGALYRWSKRFYPMPEYPKGTSYAGDYPQRMTEYESKLLLAHYGIPFAECKLVTSVDEAKTAAKEIGYPVVLKVMSPDILHKTDAGVIALNIKNEAELEKGYDKILSAAKTYKKDAEIRGVLVEKMVSVGLEMIVGAKKDPVFGPIVLVGLGGIFVEVLKDVSMAPAPIDKEYAMHMIESLKGYPLLKGARGQRPLDIEALCDVLVKISELICIEKDVKELDINPLFVYEKGLTAVDALVIK